MNTPQASTDLEVDGRCPCERCGSRTTDTYRLAGRCWNCGATGTATFRAGDRKRVLDCPACGCRDFHA